MTVAAMVVAGGGKGEGGEGGGEGGWGKETWLLIRQSSMPAELVEVFTVIAPLHGCTGRQSMRRMRLGCG
eukprot:351288-Chlamydomonas_euryale.AAC.1